MEDYLKVKKEQIIKNNLIAEQKILLHKKKVEKILQNFEQNLQEVNKKEIDHRLRFYINSTYFLGLFKSSVKNEYFKSIFIDNNLYKKLIEVNDIINVIDSLNKHTIFYFNKNKILNIFLEYSFAYLFNEILLRVSLEKDDFHGCYNDFFVMQKKVKRQLVENVKFPRNEDESLVLKEYRLHKQKHIEITKISTVPLKSFEYVIGKCYSHPHKLAYQPLVNYLKEYNQDLLKDAFNETEFYVALYDLLKAISYDKEHYKDDDESFIEVDYKNNLKNYKSKVVRNWFS